MHGPPIVIDNGSFLSKVGFGGNEAPKSVFPTVIARKQDLTCFGDEALNQEIDHDLLISYPVQKGIVNNYEDIELVWQHIFDNVLKVSPEEHPMFLTDSINEKQINRCRKIEIMMEKVKAPKFYLASQAVMAMYASGRITGIVLDSGAGVTQTVTTYEGNGVYQANLREGVTGTDIDAYLYQRLFSDNTYPYNQNQKMKYVRDIKETKCFVEQEKSFKNHNRKDMLSESYYLPDGEEIKLNYGCCSSPEVLFTPSLSQLKKSKGVVDLLKSSIQLCDKLIWADLYGNIILSGGSTIFPGFHRRIRNEVRRIAPRGINVNVIALANRKYLAWQGGSITSALPQFSSQYVTKEEYEESGSGMVAQKCF